MRTLFSWFFMLNGFLVTQIIKAPKTGLLQFRKIIPSEERSAFFQIAYKDKPERMKHFLSRRDKKVLHRTISNTERSTVHHAAAGGNIKMLTYLLKHKKVRQYIDKSDIVMRTPLYEAIVYGHIEAAKLLEKKGAKIRVESFSLLSRARRWNRLDHQEAIEQYLIEKNTDKKCTICFELFDEERRKNVLDDQCLNIICCFCKAQCDTCPFCRKKLK